MNSENFAHRHPLVGLVDEAIRLNSRLRSVFATARAGCALNDSEHMVLNSVVEADRLGDRPPTVAQIARSMGYARQVVQRAANALRDSGLIESFENPDHKRAPLLRPTPEGVELKCQIDARADVIAEELVPGIDPAQVLAAQRAMRDLRKQIEVQLRKSSSTRKGDGNGR